MLPIRILMVDDSPAFLEAASHFLALDPDIQVVGCATSGYEALAKIVDEQPDMVLLDLTMPDLDGLETARLIKACPDAPYIVILTLHDHHEYRAAALAAGASGFLNKAEFGTELPLLLATLFPRGKLDARGACM